MTAMRTMKALPLFPLPEVVLLPETLLPLHVFEPRYRDLLRDALEGDQLIGLQTIDPGADPGEGYAPPLLPIGCAGEVIEHSPLEDGRSNIVLKGTFRYRIVREIPGRSYRRADVLPLPVEPLPAGDPRTPGRRDLRRILSRLVDRLAVSVGREEARTLDPGLSDEALVNEALSRLGLPAADRYRILAMDRLFDRYAWALEHVVALQQRVDLLAPYWRQKIDPRSN